MFGQDTADIGNNNHNASFGTSKPINPASSLNTLSEYTTPHHPGNHSGGLALDVTQNEKLGIDVTHGQGILKFPPVFTGKDDNRDYVDNRSLVDKGPGSIKKPVRHGTLHNFDPDANPR